MNEKRIKELNDLAAETGKSLALPAEQICHLEDTGWIVDPFTGRIQMDPEQTVTILTPSPGTHICIQHAI